LTISRRRPQPRRRRRELPGPAAEGQAIRRNVAVPPVDTCTRFRCSA